MEFFGYLAFIMILFVSEKVKKLEKKIKQLERKLRGDKSMSKILLELVDKKCILVSDLGYSIDLKREIECTVLDVDDEWIKFTFINKKGVRKTQTIRIEAIERVISIEE